ncbi:hypothetical protein N0V95_009043 [Ascochyta clinopodiicola]|nr:hypothetical protein N0V95_009043 [Ascochyta clinopodiicola]
MGPEGLLFATAGLSAATIRYYAGTFYVVCTNNYEDHGELRTDNFFVTTTDIWSDHWSKPTYFKWSGIDPSLFFDDDGTCYVTSQWSKWSLTQIEPPVGTIKQAKINLATGELLTEPKLVWEGFSKIDTEGPHLYKKDGYYYLLVAEGGTFDKHMLSISRSKDIWGPYDSYEQNPILTAHGKDEYVQHTGHGDIFQDGYGKWWIVVLAVRKDPAGRNALSRETYLAPVAWPKGGWPSIEQPRINMSRPGSECLKLEHLVYSQRPDVDDVYLRDMIADNYIAVDDDRRIVLRATSRELSTPTGTTTFVGKRQRALNMNATTILHHSDQAQGTTLRAGLAIYKDNCRYIEICYEYSTWEVCLRVVSRISEPWINNERRKVPVDAHIEFRVVTTEMSYEFSYRTEKQPKWCTIGNMDVLEWTSNEFTSPIIGIFASNSDNIKVEFTSLRMSDPL